MSFIIFFHYSTQPYKFLINGWRKKGKGLRFPLNKTTIIEECLFNCNFLNTIQHASIKMLYEIKK